MGLHPPMLCWILSTPEHPQGLAHRSMNDVHKNGKNAAVRTGDGDKVMALLLSL